MSRTLWLHCGSFKSGSSRIQRLAWERRDELEAAGWVYPSAGLVTDEPDVGVRHSDLVYLHREPERWRAMVADLVAEVAASPAGNVLMSSEAWSRPGKGEGLAELLAALRGAGVVDEVHAVLYLRNRYAYARSFYRELTRRRDNVLPLAEFVADNPRPLDYLDVLRALREAVAPGELQVFAYDGIPDTGAHFFGLLGLEVPAEEARENVGIPAVEVEAHRQLNRVAPEAREHWPGLPAALAELPASLDLGEGWTERFADGQLDADEDWRAGFAAETGWPAADVDALLRRPDEEEGRDVTELAGLLHGMVLTWLDRVGTPTVEVATYPHPGVDVLVVDRPDPHETQFRLSGLLLPAASLAPGWRLLAVGDGEEEARVGKASPAFGREHPDRPDAARARFGVPRCTFGAHGRVDLVLEQVSGERSVLATLRRRVELRLPPG